MEMEKRMRDCLDEGDTKRARDLNKHLDIENRALMKKVKTLEKKLNEKEEGKVPSADAQPHKPEPVSARAHSHRDKQSHRLLKEQEEATEESDQENVRLKQEVKELRSHIEKLTQRINELEQPQSAVAKKTEE
jgi:hypothetical protein